MCACLRALAQSEKPSSVHMYKGGDGGATHLGP